MDVRAQVVTAAEGEHCKQEGGGFDQMIMQWNIRDIHRYIADCKWSSWTAMLDSGYQRQTTTENIIKFHSLIQNWNWIWTTVRCLKKKKDNILSMTDNLTRNKRNVFRSSPSFELRMHKKRAFVHLAIICTFFNFLKTFSSKLTRFS